MSKNEKSFNEIQAMFDKLVAITLDKTNEIVEISVEVKGGAVATSDIKVTTTIGEIMKGE